MIRASRVRYIRRTIAKLDPVACDEGHRAPERPNVRARKQNCRFSVNGLRCLPQFHSRSGRRKAVKQFFNICCDLLCLVVNKCSTCFGLSSCQPNRSGAATTCATAWQKKPLYSFQLLRAPPSQGVLGRRIDDFIVLALIDCSAKVNVAATREV